MAIATEDHQLLVDGNWVETGTWHEVHSPYDASLVGRLPRADAALTQRAIDAAARAMEMPLAQHERAAILLRAAGLIARHEDEIAQLICAEAGKPIAAARIEAQRAVSTFEAAAIAAHELHGETVPMASWATGAGRIGFTVRRPVGVVGAITPFNFPINLVSHKVAPAIAAGCAIVLKPAEKTPLTALLLARLLEQAGLPAGWLNVVVGPAAEIAQVLCDDPRVRLITFTGSTTIGEGLRTRAPYAKVMLELGNATPVVVAADADLDDAVAKLCPTSFFYAGQTCVSVQRIYVERAAFDGFLEKFLAATANIAAGDPEDEHTIVGPSITPEAHDRIMEWIEEARAGGARIATGGSSLGNSVIEPTVITGTTPDMKVASQEVFGPVVVIEPVDSLEDGYRLANATQYGLQGAVFTASLATSIAAVDAMRFGSVLVNESPSFRADHMPYGGTKQSGNTKEGPGHAILEMTEEQLVVIARPTHDGPAATSD